MLLLQLLPSADSTQSLQRWYLSLFVFMAAVLTQSLRRSQLNVHRLSDDVRRVLGLQDRRRHDQPWVVSWVFECTSVYPFPP